MKMSTKLRYGLRFMLNLSENYHSNIKNSKPLLLKKISQEEGISEKYLSQIVLYLKKTGLIDSVRGAKGGYVLSKDPKDISLKNIYDALEGDSLILEAVNYENFDKISDVLVSEVWKEVNNVIDLKMSKISLFDILEMKNKGNEINYSI